MVDEIEQKLKWFLLLMPGFISFALARYVSDMGDVSEFEFTLYSLALSVVNVSVSVVLHRVILWRSAAGREPRFSNGLFVALLLGITCVTGVIIGGVYESDMILKGIRHFWSIGAITKRSYQRPLTLLLSQNRLGRLEEGRPPGMKVTEAWVRVRLKDGEVYEGYPEFFSTGGEAGEIFLSPACAKGKNPCAKTTAIQGPGILVFESEVRAVESLDRPKSECYKLWEDLESRPAKR